MRSVIEPVNPMAADAAGGYRPPYTLPSSTRVTTRSPAPIPRVVFFLHLPRTAGTTLARVIGRQYTSEAILPLYDSSTGEEIGSVPPDRLDSLRAIVGHFYFGAHRFLARPSTYVTVLRDPVDRVISHYHFVRADPTHYLHESARQMSLREYVISCDLAEPNNDQTRLLCGEYQGSVPHRCSDEMLPVATKHLREHFAVVGLTEEYDRSLVLLKRVLGWSYPFYVRQNVTPRRLRKQDLPSETLRVIETYNRLDIALYRDAGALLREQIRAQGDSFDRELRAFLWLNAVLGRGHSLLSSTLGRLRRRV
jgi:hypothetical protein